MLQVRQVLLLTATTALETTMAANETRIVPEKLPDKMEGVYYELKVGDLTAVIGDHYDHGSGLPGYTAVRHLSHNAFPYSCFRPRYAGLLHTRGSRKVDVIKVSDREVIITPRGSKRGHWERFILTEPHYVDYEYNFYATQRVHWIGWCCYMNTLRDPGIYVMQNREWVRHYSSVHSIDASLAPRSMKELPKFKKVPNSRYPSGYPSFADTFAPIRFNADRSFYFGHFHDMAFIWMFSRGDDILPFMSPTGGGSKNNPAWDARYWLRDCEPGKKVSLKMRVALKPFVSNDDCAEEYVKWKHMLDDGELDKLRYPLWDVRGPKQKVFYLDKPWDRPFEVQVFKTQLQPSSRGTVTLLDPDGRESARADLRADGDEHRHIQVAPDGKHGIYRLVIDADVKSCWNVVTDLYREALAADRPVTLHRRVSGRRFYFHVQEGTRSFRARVQGQNGTFSIWSPEGDCASSVKLSGGTATACKANVEEGSSGKLWSLSFMSDSDVTLVLEGDGAPCAFSAYPAGLVSLPATR